MRKEIEETYIAKFDDPMTSVLYTICGDGGQDEDMGDVTEDGLWAARLGRHVVYENSQGFVGRAKLAGPREQLGDEFARWFEDATI